MSSNTKDTVPSISDLMAQFERDQGVDDCPKAREREAHPEMVYGLCELTTVIYRNGVMQVLEILGQDSEEIINHVNDRSQLMDFPHDDECIEELRELTGLGDIPGEIHLWELGKAVSASVPNFH